MRTNLIKSDREYNRILDDMRGVDASGRGDSVTCRYAYTENMYRDYSSGRGSLIESVPGFRKIYHGNDIIGLHLQSTASGERYIIINDGGTLWRCRADSLTDFEKLKENPTIGGSPSFTFSFDGKLFIGNGSNLFSISDSGSVIHVSDIGKNQPYIPTVYLDGVEHEQRSLLTARCYEKFNLLPPARLMLGSNTLLYKITDEKNMLCSVSGISDGTSRVFIPETVSLGGKEYTVTAIDNGAFSGNRTVSFVTVADSIRSVGVGAFYGCTALSSFIGGASLTEICDNAFDGSALKSIYIPAGFKSFGSQAIPSGTDISYELGETAYKNIVGSPDGCTVEYGAINDTITIGARIRTKAKTVVSVKVNGGSVGSYSIEYNGDGYISQIIIENVSRSQWMGGVLEVCLNAQSDVANESSRGEDFTVKSARASIGFYTAITHCKHAKLIGGRIFAWGNPSFPSVIFYSSKRDSQGLLYFGSLDYIDLGGNSEMLSVLPLTDGIAIFAKHTEGGESIFFCEDRIREGAISESYYAVSGSRSSAALCGAVASIGGESVFLTEDGLLAIGEKTIYESYKLEPRSSLIAPLLKREDLTDATISEWCGYTVLSINGSLYLADQRRSAKTENGYEPEWFCLRGVGTYKNDKRVYRYATQAREGYLLSEDPDGRVSEEVWSEGLEDGSTVYFVKRGDEKIEVYPTEEMEGGDFYGAKLLLGYADSLLFSTECGDVCAFNSDMRGVAPEFLRSAPDFDPEEYSRRMGNRIHPAFYDFNGHAPRYALITAPDDCGVPHLRKSTVKRSLTLKLATFIGGQICCEVGRDGQGFRRVGVVDGGITDMSELSFHSLPFDGSESVTVAMPEGERGWIEKSLALYSDGFRSPIGVYSICYRYRISGRVKN